MIEEIEAGRILAAGDDTSYDTAMKLFCFAKNLMTTFRLEWTKPNPTSSCYAKSKYCIIPDNWLEELLIVSYRITECFIVNPEIYLKKKKIKKEKKYSNLTNSNQNSSESSSAVLNNDKTKNKDYPYYVDPPTCFTSLLLYAAVQLSQLDVIPCLVDKIVQNLLCVDLIIPFFVHTDNFMAVSLIINAYSDKMSDFTLLCACIYLSRYQTFNDKCKGLMDKLESKATNYISKNTDNNSSENSNSTDQPNDNPSTITPNPNDNRMITSKLIIETIASVRLSFLIHNQPIKVIQERRDDCFKIINEAIQKCPDSFQLYYNLAYIYGLIGNKDKCFESLKKSLQLKPNDSRSILFMMRVLRSRKQPRVALAFHSKAKKLLNDQSQYNCSSKLMKEKDDTNCFFLDDEINYRNIGSRNGNGNQDTKKLVEIEEIYATYEANLNPEAKKLTDMAKLRYGNDDKMMASLIRIELMMNNGKQATEMFRKWINDENSWSSISSHHQSPEFFFCFAQICIESNDLPTAENYLRKAIEIEPFNVEYQSALACVLSKMGKMDDGLEKAKFAVKLDPESPHAWLAMSCSSKNQDEKEGAKKRSLLLENARIDLSNIHIIIFPQENTVLNI